MLYKKLMSHDYDFSDIYKEGDPHKYIPLGGVDAEYLVFNNKNNNYDDTKYIIDTIKSFNSSKDYLNCYKELVLYFDNNIDHILINYIDNFNNTLVESRDDIDPTFIYKLARKIVYNTSNIELFKLGIFLLSCVIVDNNIKDEIIEYSLCDEFSFYCLHFHFNNWENSNNLKFRVLKKLTGWGKIYFVQDIDVVNDKIRKYLINDGFKNSINNSYLVSSIIEKIDIVDYLNKDISKEEFINISLLIDALFNDTLTNSLGKINNTLLLFERIFNLFKKYSDAYSSYYAISLIYLYLQDSINEEKLLKEEIRKYVTSKKFRNNIINYLDKSSDEEFKSILFLLITFNIDIEKYVYNKYISDVNKYYYSIEYLLKYSKYRDKSIKKLEDNFIFDLEDSLPMIRLNYDYDFKLMQIIRDIRNYPNVGSKFIDAGLKNSNFYVRKETINTIFNWYREGNLELDEYSFYNTLIDLLDVESVKELKNNLNNLFDREENLDYLNNIKINIVDSNEWINIDWLVVKKMFSDNIIKKTSKLKIDKLEKIDNQYRAIIDGKNIIIDMSVDNRIKWYSCTCDKINCVHLCKLLLVILSKEM